MSIKIEMVRSSLEQLLQEYSSNVDLRYDNCEFLR